MIKFMENLAAQSDFMPHGFCFAWNVNLLWLHLGSDILTAIAYYVIAGFLAYLVFVRRDVPFNWMFILFGLFIFACGTTHLMSAWTVYVPSYWAEGEIKAFNATISVVTAILLLPLTPRIITLPSLQNSLDENSRLNKSLNLRVTDLKTEISRRKQTEKAHQKLMDNLEDKTAEMERFVYTVSHDLKSPLITIQGFLGLLEKDAIEGEAERLHGDVGQIQKAAGQMQELLRDLLEISRIGRLANPPEKVSLNELAQEAVEMLDGQIKKCGARIDVASDLPTLFGDRKRLLEVVQNLIDNALKFRGEQTDPYIEIGVRREKGENICYIRDNGIGIEPRFHKKVFELFERLDPAVDGTGIGLAIAKRIIDLEGGRLWIESEGKGKGSTFCFVLPEGKDQTFTAEDAG